MGHHTTTRLAEHWKEVLDRFKLMEGCLLGITTDNASSNYSMSGVPQLTLEASGMEWPALRNHIPWMAHIIHLALGAFMSSLGVKGRTKSWGAHKCNQQFGDNECVDIGKSQRHTKKGNDRLNMVSAMRCGLAKIVEEVRISRNFELPETGLQRAANTCCIDDADTGMSKQVHWLTNS